MTESIMEAICIKTPFTTLYSLLMGTFAPPYIGSHTGQHWGPSVKVLGCHMSHHAHHNYCSLFLQKMTDFKEQCIYIKLLFQTSKIGAETFQMLTLAFREEAMWQTVVFDCSAEYGNGMTSVKDAEYSECLPTGSMYRNVEHIYGIWHERSCITIHNLANELGSLLVYATKF